MKKVVNLRPLLFIALSLAAGITFAFFFIVAQKTVYAILSAAVFLCCAVWFFAYSVKSGRVKVSLFYLAAFIFAFAFGACAFGIKAENYKNADLDGHVFSVDGKITEIVYEDYGSRFLLDDVTLGGVKSGKIKYKISVTAYGDFSAEIGDTVSFETTLTDRDLYYEGSFASDALSSGIKYSASVQSSEITITGNSADIFDKCRLFIGDSLRAGLDDDEFGVAYAMLLGCSDEMRESTLASYRNAGIAHIFAVSGLHIGFVASAVYFLFKLLKVNKKVVPFAVFAACLFYSGICGFTASSLRATVMCLVASLAKNSGERYDPLSSVSFAAVVVLAIFPVQLFCAGFQLSFGVVYGMVLLARPLAYAFKFLPNKIANSLGAVLAAQAFSIPISVAWFGSFSVFSVIANLIFLPVTGTVFTSLLVLALVGGAFSCSKAALFIPRYVLKGINVVVTAIDYDWFIISGVTFGAFATFYYAAIVVSCGVINLKSLAKTVVSVSCAVVCAVGCVAGGAAEYNSVKVYASGAESVCFSVVSSEDLDVLVVAYADGAFSTTTLKRLSDKFGVKELDCVALIDVDGENSLQTVATKVLHVFKTKSIYYYGEKRYEQETITEKSFSNLSCDCLSLESVSIENASLKFISDGRGVAVKIKDKSVAVFGDGESFFTDESEEKPQYDFIAAYNLEERIYDVYRPKNFASFRSSVVFDDCETNGILVKTL